MSTTDTDLVYSVEKGLHSVPQIEELAWKDKENFDEWLKRTGFETSMIGAGSEYATHYKCFERNADAYPFMIDFGDFNGTSHIYCSTLADWIALRAFLAPTVIAEEGFFTSAIEEICSASLLKMPDGRHRLDEKSNLVQLVKQLGFAISK